jgi:hypothetical protein
LPNAEQGASSPERTPGREVLERVLERPIAHRFGSWDATIHLHVIGDAKYTLRIENGRAELLQGSKGTPTCIFVIGEEGLRALYAGERFVERLMEHFKKLGAVATSFEDVIMFAKCFDHVKVPPVEPRRRDARSGRFTTTWQLARAIGAILGALARKPATPLRAAGDRANDLGTYWLDRVSLRNVDLSGFQWIASTPGGLYALNEKTALQVVAGDFNGIAVTPGLIYAFQANDLFLKRTYRGRIVRLKLDGARIVDAAVMLRGLDNRCHQIDLIGGRLFICDTEQDRILELDEQFHTVDTYAPAGQGRSSMDKPHINSVLAIGDRRYAMCHNSTEWTNRPSEILECDARFNVTRRITLRGGACHSLAAVDGRVAYCLSELGEVECEGTTLARIDGGLFARGLAVDSKSIVVGGSELPHRSDRRLSRGRVFFFDRSGVRRAVVPIPGALRDIRPLSVAGVPFS